MAHDLELLQGSHNASQHGHTLKSIREEALTSPQRGRQKVPRILKTSGARAFMLSSKILPIIVAVCTSHISSFFRYCSRMHIAARVSASKERRSHTKATTAVPRGKFHKPSMCIHSLILLVSAVCFCICDL